jgi:predicted sugar kinase
MNKIAKGTIVFTYNLNEDPFPEKHEGLTHEEIIKSLIEEMVEDVISMSYSDLGPAIEMEIVQFDN